MIIGAKKFLSERVKAYDAYVYYKNEPVLEEEEEVKVSFDMGEERCAFRAEEIEF